MHLKEAILTGCLIITAAVALKADVILPNHHIVERCVTIGNLDEFPDIVIVGCYTTVTGNPHNVERYIVKPDSCLTKGGYKFNSFYLFWVEKSYLESQGLSNLPLEKFLPQAAKQRIANDVTLPMGLFTESIEPSGGTLPDSNPVVKENLVYVISACGGIESYAVRLARKVSIDREGNESVEVYLTTAITVPELVSISTPLCINAHLGRGYLLFTSGFNGNAYGELIDCRGKAVMRFTRECRNGCTYMVRSTRLSAGIYWLRLKRGGTAINIPMRIFE